MTDEHREWKLCFKLGKFHEWALKELISYQLVDETEYLRGKQDAYCELLDEFDKHFEGLQ